jgi:catechol 2,3-dioxygenase-like lactoylglutathione lyase family enzyme
LGFRGVHHVAVICADLERSLAFYVGLLGARARAARAERGGCRAARMCARACVWR